MQKLRHSVASCTLCFNTCWLQVNTHLVKPWPYKKLLVVPCQSYSEQQSQLCWRLKDWISKYKIHNLKPSQEDKRFSWYLNQCTEPCNSNSTLSCNPLDFVYIQTSRQTDSTWQDHFSYHSVSAVKGNLSCSQTISWGAHFHNTSLPILDILCHTPTHHIKVSVEQYFYAWIQLLVCSLKKKQNM